MAAEPRQGETDDRQPAKPLNIPVAHRRVLPAFTRRVRDVPVALGLPTLEELEEEFFGYVDVLLGRVEPPVDHDILTLMECCNAYLSRAYEVDMLIHSAERNRDILRSSPYSKFRTGELRSFIELARKAQELGSRRLTMAQLLAEAQRTGNEIPMDF